MGIGEAAQNPANHGQSVSPCEQSRPASVASSMMGLRRVRARLASSAAHPRSGAQRSPVGNCSSRELGGGTRSFGRMKDDESGTLYRVSDETFEYTPATPLNAGPPSAIERAFEQFITRKAFPCLGAKSAQARGQLHYLHAGDIASDRTDRLITAGVQAFAADVTSHSMFVSLVVLFPRSAPLSEGDFEAALWQRLQSIHSLDSSSHRWDPAVSDDPASARFSMSIGGRAFYVIGLHPNASRPARRFSCPTLVFNLHSQFERLREDGRYGKLRRAIIERDVAYSGSANPMLAIHGESSEARQYSGRQVDAGWVCPFHAKNERNPE
jgi:FPC/CPF motif-containing protein YcgG